MNKLYNYTFHLLTAMVLLIAACGRKDILPEAVGEPVPYEPAATRTWKAIMDDAHFSHFKAAWTRSNMDAWVKKTNSAYHTLFLPTDKAFTDGGWSLDRINTASVAELDSLLAFYVVTGHYKPESLQTPVIRSMVMNTLLTKANVPGYNANLPYIFRLYAGTWNDSLMINGKPVAEWSAYEEAVNGGVYPIAALVKRPAGMMIDYIRSDPRFSLLLQAITASATYYTGARSINNPQFINFLNGSTKGRQTMFLPTNEAFAKSGYHTVQDVRDRIARSLPVKAAFRDANNYQLYPITAFDSLLMPHGFSLFRNREDGLFYSRDLLRFPRQLSGFMLLAGQTNQTPPMILQTAFNNDNGRLMVRDYQSTGAWQPIAEADIECWNGVIHVVNDFIMLP